VKTEEKDNGGLLWKVLSTSKLKTVGVNYRERRFLKSFFF
jgi:hypothetical protein